jgi:hypothetical protein
MTSFSPSEAAVEGFRLLRREPMTFVTWAGVLIVVSLLSYGGMYLAGMPAMMHQMSEVQPGDPQAAARLMSMMGSFFGVFFLVIPLVLLIYSVVVCGVYRAVLRPEEKGFARLRLGADEFRMILLWIVLGLLGFVAAIAFVIVAAIVGAVVGMSLAAGGTGHGGGAGVFLMIALIYLGYFAFCIWFWVQFSMAAPMTFAERRLAIFESFQVVKGHFWSLVGCFLLTLVIALICILVLACIQLPASMALGAPSIFAAMEHPGQTPDTSYIFQPAYIVVMSLINALGVVIYPIVFAPQAAAYRDITGSAAPPAPAEEGAGPWSSPGPVA